MHLVCFRLASRNKLPVLTPLPNTYWVRTGSLLAGEHGVSGAMEQIWESSHIRPYGSPVITGSILMRGGSKRLTGRRFPQPAALGKITPRLLSKTSPFWLHDSAQASVHDFAH